jgi:hypothetical protein
VDAGTEEPAAREEKSRRNQQPFRVVGTVV